MKVAIYANDREVSEQVKQQLIEKLSERNIQIDQDHPDIVLTIGGDGTVLHAVHYYMNQIEQIKFKIGRAHV